MAANLSQTAPSSTIQDSLTIVRRNAVGVSGMEQGLNHQPIGQWTICFTAWATVVPTVDHNTEVWFTCQRQMMVLWCLDVLEVSSHRGFFLATITSCLDEIYTIQTNYWLIDWVIDNNNSRVQATPENFHTILFVSCAAMGTWTYHNQTITFKSEDTVQKKIVCSHQVRKEILPQTNELSSWPTKECKTDRQMDPLRSSKCCTAPKRYRSSWSHSYWFTGPSIFQNRAMVWGFGSWYLRQKCLKWISSVGRQATGLE